MVVLEKLSYHWVERANWEDPLRSEVEEREADEMVLDFPFLDVDVYMGSSDIP